MKLEIGDKVLCTVDRVVGTGVFVKIDNNGVEGEIIMSEIAPGRIRNLRDYVVPKKKIVCKVLRISDSGNIELSLRRVTQKEKKEVLEKDNQEKSYLKILKSILGEIPEDILKEIEKEGIIFFMDNVRDNPKILEDIIGKENAKKIVDILNNQKKKKTIVKKELHLTTLNPNGITLIKKILSLFKDIEVKYIAAGKYSLSLESEDVKNADKKIKEAADSAEKEAKKLGVEFFIK